MKLLIKKVLFILFIIPTLSDLSYGDPNIYEYKNCNDSITKDITIDKKLKSEFFNITEKSYPWYIIKKDDGTFENVISDDEVTEEDRVLIEYTSNCITDHRGSHMMRLCDAKLIPDGIQLKISGGEPAWANSFLIKIIGNKFYCYFRANYPVLHDSLKWNILSKELKLKDNDFKKGKRIYAWISVKFEEIAVFNGETTKRKYSISGYLKPILE